VSDTILLSAAAFTAEAPGFSWNSAPTIVSAAINDRESLLAQFLTDDKDNAETRNRVSDKMTGQDSLKTQAVFIMGLSGAISNQEGFAMVSAMSVLGIQYGKFYFTADPVFTYSKTKSLKHIKNVFGSKSTGEVLDFGLPAKCTFAFLDLATYPYTPYIQAGSGYNIRKYSYSGSSFMSRINNTSFADSLTLHCGFGLIIAVTRQTRIQIGFSGISYFNTKQGVFAYDTTGASLMFGLIAVYE
jgi:hypothetical protein